jgi:hypothetical protein
LTATLLIWDNTNNVWLDKSNSVTQPWVSFLKTDASPNKAGMITIYQTSSVFVPEQTYQVKIRITDMQAANPTAIAIEHSFTVDIYHACSRNTIAFASDQTSQTFIINAVPASSVPVVIPNSVITSSEPESVCTLIRSLEIYDTNALSWVRFKSASASTYPWITAWTDPVGPGPAYTSSTNGFTVFTTNYVAYKNTSFQLRMNV